MLVQSRAKTEFALAISSPFQFLKGAVLVAWEPFFLMKARYEAMSVSFGTTKGMKARTRVQLADS